MRASIKNGVDDHLNKSPDFKHFLPSHYQWLTTPAVLTRHTAERH